MGKITTIGIPSGGTTGQVLKKKTGTNYDVEWGTGGGGGTPGGSDTQVQFNDGGSFGGDAGLTYDKTNNVLDLESIDFATTPTAADATGRLHWDNDEGSLVLTLKGGNLTIPLGQEVTTLVYNAEATTLTKGEVVYAFGASGQRVSVKRAINTGDSTSAQTLGVVAESITSGAEGFVMIQGMVRGLNTSTYTQGDAIYLGSSAGTFTKTKPYAPNHLVYVGFVVKVHASAGEIFVKCQNGYEMDELHNVSAQSPSNNDILAYNTSTSLWEKKQLTAIGGVTGTGTTNELTYWTGSTAIGSLTTATYPSLTELSYVKGVTSAIQTQLNARPTGTGTSGQIAYWSGTSTQTGSSTFTFSPTAQLLVNNSVTAAGAIARGVNFTPTLTAAANNDVLVGLDINPTFTNGAFTGVSNFSIRTFHVAQFRVGILISNTANTITTGQSISGSGTGNFDFRNGSGNGWYFDWIQNNSTAMRLSTGNNLLIGTTTDSGYKLDVNGTTRTQGDLTISDTKNIILGTTTGTKIGTATTQKIGFYNATPVVQPSAVTTSQGIANALSSLGLLASSSISSVPDVGGKLYLFNSY